MTAYRIKQIDTVYEGWRKLLKMAVQMPDGRTMIREVLNSGDAAATITADDGSFDVDVPGHALVTFRAPDLPGRYPFGSRTDPAHRDVLTVE